MIDEKTLSQSIQLLLDAGADYADIFAEKSRYFNAVSDDHKISTSAHDQIGIGIRAIRDNSDFSIIADSHKPENIMELSSTLASGLKSEGSGKSVSLSMAAPATIYNPRRDPRDIDMPHKIEMMRAAEETAWGYSGKIKQATIRYSDFDREVLFVSSEDQQIMTQRLALIEFISIVYAGNGKERQLGWSGKSFYRGWEALEGKYSPENLVKEACRQALLMLEARDCPAGEMPVVFAPGPNGVLFHESCGHGMEADLVQKGSSFAGMVGSKVASDKVTIKDSGLIDGFPGSFAFDDEGIEAQDTFLIEKGILRGYLHSRLTASQMNTRPTGSGRRQSFRYPPLPRMRNTYILDGDDDPEEIISSTRKGLYAADVGFGGQVDVVTGRFITSIILGYMIEDGKLTYPVKGATITGVGIDALRDIDMVGNDMLLDPSPGRCGKGQEVPVGVGMPTVRVKKLVVGGTGSELSGGDL